jgi:hypothetical protein
VTAFTPVPRPPVRHSFLRFVHDRNPFYLLSALSMFVGFRVILAALNSTAGDWRKLLLLIAILNLYEVAIIGLALFLIVRRSLWRDGWFLLSIEALFLVDLTNLNAELFTAMPRLGAVVNAVSLGLAMAKILIVCRVLGLRLSRGTVAYIVAQLAFLLGLPGLFWLLRSPTANVSAMQIYGVWWLLAGLIVAGGLLVRRPAGDSSPLARLPWRLYVLVPLVSLLVHLASQNRVYSVHFQIANLGPVLLAAVVVLNRTWSAGREKILQWSIGLAAAAVLLSIVPHPYERELATVMHGLILTPLRAALLASAATLLFVGFHQRSPIAMGASSGNFVLACLGPSVPGIRHNLGRCLRWAGTSSHRLVPETELSWGVLAVLAAFVLLGVGAVVSLHQPPPSPPDAPPDPLDPDPLPNLNDPMTDLTETSTSPC